VHPLKLKEKLKGFFFFLSNFKKGGFFRTKKTAAVFGVFGKILGRVINAVFR